MKTDLYTKVILTIIALVLVINLIKDLPIVTPVQATPISITSSTVSQEKDIVDVNIVQFNGKEIKGAYSNVDKAYNGIPISIYDINKYFRDGQRLNVKIEREK